MIRGELHDVGCRNDPCTCEEVTVGWIRDPDTYFGAPKPSTALREPKTLRQRIRSVPVMIRVRVLERDSHLCQWCRRPGGSLIMHHRLRRSQGGKDHVRTLVSVHGFCHDELHRDITEAKRRRFLVTRNEELDEAWE